MTADALAIQIVREAGRFVGLRETRANKAWDKPSTPGRDTELERELLNLMRPSPWEPGWAYCAAFVEGIVSLALRKCGASDDEQDKFRAVMSPHCLTSFNAFNKLKLISAEPVAGSIWLARHGATTNGHAGLITGVSPAKQQVSSIEANTSLDPSSAEKEREGDWITTRVFFKTGRGTLRTLGFVTPANIIALIHR